MADILARQRAIVGTTSDWALHDIVLGDGEIALERSGAIILAKAGNGAQKFSEAPYIVTSQTALRFKGTWNPTTAPPAGAIPGDAWAAIPGGVVAASWGPPVAGQTIAEGDWLAKTASGAWAIVPGSPDLALYVPLADLASSSGAGLAGFSHAVSYPAGTLGAKGRDTVSVKDAPFNAKGDGVADDTAAIQAAINALATSGGTVLVPRGIYKITSTISLPGRVCLLGERSGGLTYPDYSAVIFSYTGTNGPCVTLAAPYRNLGIHNILVNCNNGANTTGFKFPSCLYSNFSDLFVMNATTAYDQTTAAGTNGIIYNNFKNIGARTCTTGLIIDGRIQAHSANQIEVGVFTACTTGLNIIECGSTTIGGERGEIGGNAVGISMSGGIVTLDGEFWMENNSTADIQQTGGTLTIAKPFRSLGRINTSLPGVLIASNPITPFKVLPTNLAINRGIINNAYSFRSRSDVVDVMGAQNLTLFNGAAAEATARTKFGAGIGFVQAESRRLTLPAGYFRFDTQSWCIGLLVRSAPATGANLLKLEGSDANLDRISFTLATNQNYLQYLKTEDAVSGTVTGLGASYEWFTDDYPHWVFVGYNAATQKLQTWEPGKGMIDISVAMSLAFLGPNVQLTVGQAGQFGTFTLDELVLFNQIPDPYTLQAIASAGADFKSLLA